MFGKNRRRSRRSVRRQAAKPTNPAKFEVTAAQPRLSLKPVLKFWHTRGARLAGILALVMLLGAMYLLFTTSAFFIYGAEIEGNSTVSAREIYLSSGLDSQSIFWISPEKVVQRVEALPNIKAASVLIQLPARVVITVEERRPEILWQSGDNLWWVDEEGTVVPPKGDVTGMLKIIDNEETPVEVGQRVDEALVTGAQQLRILAPDLTTVRYTPSHGLIVSTPEGWPVYLGNGSEVRAKLVVLTSLLADLNERNVEPAYIDLRDPLRPVYQPRSLIKIEPPPQRPVPVQPIRPPQFQPPPFPQNQVPIQPIPPPVRTQ